MDLSLQGSCDFIRLFYFHRKINLTSIILFTLGWIFRSPPQLPWNEPPSTLLFAIVCRPTHGSNHTQVHTIKEQTIHNLGGKGVIGVCVDVLEVMGHYVPVSGIPEA